MPSVIKKILINGPSPNLLQQMLLPVNVGVKHFWEDTTLFLEKPILLETGVIWKNMIM
jgi:hypothetical protein